MKNPNRRRYYYGTIDLHSIRRFAVGEASEPKAFGVGEPCEHSPLEHWMGDYKRIFEAWEDGGVRGIVFGYLRFMQSDGTAIPTFPPDPKVFASLTNDFVLWYAEFGVSPPAEAPRDLDKEKLLNAMLDDAASRGWHIMTFSVPSGGGSRPLAEDPYGAVGFAARVQDTMNAFPQAHGVIIDVPGEKHYELAYHHGGELFARLTNDEASYGSRFVKASNFLLT